MLADGTYLSRAEGAPATCARPARATSPSGSSSTGWRTPAGQVTETFTLITTLLDPGTAPARELAELYHARWQIETALGAFKSEMKGNGVVLRSKTPDGAEQEIWALLCAYHAIREMICAAAALAR